MKPLHFMGSSLDDLRDFRMKLAVLRALSSKLFKADSNRAIGNPCRESALA